MKCRSLVRQSCERETDGWRGKVQITGGTYKNVLSKSVRRSLSLRGWRVEEWIVRHSVVGRRQRRGSTAEWVVGSKVGAGTRRRGALA